MLKERTVLHCLPFATKHKTLTRCYFAVRSSELDVQTFDNQRCVQTNDEFKHPLALEISKLFLLVEKNPAIRGSARRQSPAKWAEKFDKRNRKDCQTKRPMKFWTVHRDIYGEILSGDKNLRHGEKSARMADSSARKKQEKYGK